MTLIIDKVYRLLKNQKISTHEKSFLKKLLPEQPVIIEAGAHIGYDTVRLAYTFPKGSIHAFEPVKQIYDQLKKETRFLTNVTTYPLALSNKTGTANIYVSEGSYNASSSLLKPKEHLVYNPQVTFEKTTTIDTITIDEWANKHNINHVDFMWLDMQGMELTTLKASPQILKTVKIIQTEVHLVESYEGVPLYSELKNWFEDNGFIVFKENFEWKDSGDIIFIKK